LSVVVIKSLLYVITCCPSWDPYVVGKNYSVGCWISFAEAMFDVVCHPWDLRASVKMAFLFQSGTCGAGDSGGIITLWQQGGILLQQQCRVLSM
jgi:hypothetical protein